MCLASKKARSVVIIVHKCIAENQGKRKTPVKDTRKNGTKSTNHKPEEQQEWTTHLHKERHTGTSTPAP